MTTDCAHEGCTDEAEFRFYNPETGGTSDLCGEHLEAVNDFFGTRSWLLAGYAVPLEDVDARTSLPLLPRNEEEQRARRSVDQLVRTGETSHHH
jgi:hypothetical protein